MTFFDMFAYTTAILFVLAMAAKPEQTPVFAMASETIDPVYPGEDTEDEEEPEDEYHAVVERMEAPLPGEGVEDITPEEPVKPKRGRKPRKAG
jgi:hypothetical protein